MKKTAVRAAALAWLAGLCFTLPAAAATVSLQSLKFSGSKPVPHFHYEGEVVEGDLDRIAAAFNQFVDCNPEALPEMGGNCAVFTLKSEGGNYIEGLKMAHFFRDNAIATWVKADDHCFSACAFAFLGGSGYSSTPTIGAYIDRSIEPGSILGFHAPYYASGALDELVAQFGLEEVLGGSRDNIALMIEQLVHWNVDSSVLAHITSMGAEDAYVASYAQDLYQLRTSLPEAPRRLWSPSPENALRNACLRLLAHHENALPFDMRDRIKLEPSYDIGKDDTGRLLSGFQITDRPSGLTVSYCAVPTHQAHLGADADIALYFGPGIDGSMRPALSFFHRPNGWSTLGTGGTASQRIFQKGSIGHFFMAPDMELSGSLAMAWRIVREDILKTGGVME